MKTYLARQPIYDGNQNLVAYELLYRSSATANYNTGELDGDETTYRVISDALTEFGLKRLTNGRVAYVNFTRGLLLGDIFKLLNPNEFVIEILEDTLIDEQLLKRVEYWRSKGFVFALDDYCGGDEFNDLLPLVDIVKVDFKGVPLSQRQTIAKNLISKGKKVLAEKVETGIEYTQAKAYGYQMFQGYYFDRPMVMSTKISAIQSSTSVRMFKEISRYEINFGVLAQIIKTDVNLSYKLLRHVSTAHYYRGHEVKSIDAALIRMGDDGVRRWVSLIFIKESTVASNDENVKIALVRGVFLESIAKQMPLVNNEEAFMVGIFSMLAVISEEKLTQLLEEVKLGINIKNALLGEDTILGKMLNFVRNYERANWVEVTKFADEHYLNIDLVSKLYIDAVGYADSTFEISVQSTMPLPADE